jgi:[acyl-carrier-protein] S-malonyltransferase
MSVNVAFLFPGQGSQAVGMGQEFFEHSPLARELFEAAAQRTGIDFEALMFSENDRLSQTEFTQPAILLVSTIAHRLFAEAVPIKPVYAMGHSLGEFSALTAVGALDPIDAVDTVHLRGKLMAQACETIDVGMLVSLGLDDATVEQLCADARAEGKQVWPVNYNADGQIVIAGIKPDLEALSPILKEAGAKRAMLLNMSVASHCPLLESAADPLAQRLEEVLREDFLAPVISNVTAGSYETKAEALELLPKQLVEPVLYKQAIAAHDDRVDCYIEFGHGNVLKGLNRKATSKPHYNVSDMASLEATIDAIGAML